jgi:tRNA(fMet)-specific endonuclease VapC
MSRFLLDTDTLSLLQQGYATVWQRANAHPVSDIVVSVVSLQEQMQGWLALLQRTRQRQQLALAYDRLVLRLLPVWTRLPSCRSRSRQSCASSTCAPCA